MSTQLVRSDPEVRTGRQRSTVEAVTAVWSAAAAALGAWWLGDPGRYTLADTAGTEGQTLVGGLPAEAASVALVLLGAVGLVAALLMARRPASSVVRRALVGVGAVEVLVFLAVVPDLRVLVLLGYACAVLGPVVLLAVVAAGAWRYPPTRYLLGGVVAVGVFLALTTGMLTPDALAEVGTGLAKGLRDNGPGLLTIAGAFAGGVLWTCTLVRYLRRSSDRCVPCGRPAAAWMRPDGIARWGSWVTIAAALCPLPYALLRLTWLTPWPILMDHDELVANPGMRMFGLSLGLAALGGAVLTIGLIRPWGEVFPRWIPVLRGRVVPAGPPAMAGLLVGAAVTIAGRTFVQMLVTGAEDATELVQFVLIFPFPVWGPLLAAASAAYYYRRRGGCAACGRS